MNMTLEQVRDYHRFHWSLNEARGTPWDGKEHEEMADAIDAHLSRQFDGVSETEAFNAFRTAYYGANKSLAPDLEAFRRGFAALTAVWHNRPAQEITADGWNCIRCGEFVDVCPKCANEMAREKAEPVAFDDAVKRAGERACGAQTQVPRDLSPGKAWEWMAREMLLAAGNYTAPPVERVRVPDALPEVQVCQTYLGEPVSPEQVAYHEGWNDCRRAMLAVAPEAVRLTAEDRVKSQYPYAYAYEFSGPNPWVIYATSPGDPGHRGEHLSHGCATREQAWSDAANKLSAAPEADHHD